MQNLLLCKSSDYTHMNFSKGRKREARSGVASTPIQRTYKKVTALVSGVGREETTILGAV